MLSLSIHCTLLKRIGKSSAHTRPYRPKSSKRHICVFWPIWLLLIAYIGCYNTQGLSKKEIEISKILVKKFDVQNLERRQLCMEIVICTFWRDNFVTSDNCVKHCDIFISKRPFCLKVWKSHPWPSRKYCWYQHLKEPILLRRCKSAAVCFLPVL